jgi:hypothetical protein
MLAAGAFFSLAYAQGTPHLEVVPTSAMPLKLPPGEAEKIIPSSSTAARGVRNLTKHADFRRSLDIALGSADEKMETARGAKRPPPATKDLAKLSIAFAPKRLGVGQQLLVAAPAGMLTDNGWSGLDRFVFIPNVGKYRLMEIDLSKSGGKFFLSSDAVNSNIENSPAGTKAFVDDEGNIIEEVVWVSRGVFHMLTYSPETSASASPSLKEKRATSVSAASIAQALTR